MKFLVWCPEYGGEIEDALTIEAPCADIAAERWAERYDRESADYTIVKGTPTTAYVQDASGGETLAFEVTGRSEPVYSAREVKRGGNGDLGGRR